MAFLADTAFQYLERAWQNNRLAHAYLISGPAKSGKAALALRLIERVNGTTAKSLDDLRDEQVMIVRPQSRSRRILIDQIRELEKRLHFSARKGKWKIGVLMDADRLQEGSENAFLKTLEEPPPQSLLLLVTSQPEQLLDTVISRCIRVPLYSRGGEGEAPGEVETTILNTLQSAFERSHSGDSGLAFRMLQVFSLLLKQTKERIRKRNDAAFKEESLQYAKAIEGDWLKKREQFYKDLSDSEYIMQRNRFLEVFLTFFGDGLRQQIGYTRLDLPAFAPASQAIANAFSPAELEKRLKAIETMRDQLTGTNVHEALALEVGFLRAFS
ncbi:MAG: hypothetical protein AAF514_04585 [Verrucomicrobiota bacterium]